MLSRTDLALEIKEKYEDDNVEIPGVILEELYTKDENIKITIVEIVDERGKMAMSRPEGKYVTIENLFKKEDSTYEEKNINEEELKNILTKYLRELTDKIEDKRILYVGLGNRDVTPDALGPLVMEQVFVTRHLIREFDEKYKNNIAAIAPGVMGQTGIEAQEIIKALIKELDINIVIAIDALAARSIHRLNNTIQITNTGICPGAGVGNNRKELNKSTLGVEVIGVGVPTVVDAATIVNETIEQFMIKQGLESAEIEQFNMELKKEIITNMFVTPKDVDECIKEISRIIANSLNEF